MRYRHVTLRTCLPLAVAALWAFARPASALDVYPLDSGLTPAQVENQPYSYYVRQCVDTLMQYGTDHYGPFNTPLLMSVIDVRNRTAPQDPLSLDEMYRAERRGRRNPGGSNLWMDQETLSVMYDLTQKTGQAKYATFANNDISYYTTNVVKSNKLINWGWHEY